MQPNIRVKRYAARSKHVRRKPPRRGSIATAVLIILIFVVAGLAVSVALAPQEPESSRKASTPSRDEPAALGGEETQTAESTSAIAPPAEPATASSRTPVSISSVSVDPELVTPSALPNCTGDDDLYPSTSIAVEMSQPATIAVSVRDQYGTTVARLFTGRLGEDGGSYEWDGKYANGDPVASGDYTVRAQVLDSEEASEQGACIDARLAAAQFIMRGNKARKAVALTIDDGWNADPGIVAYLRKNKVPATAFLIGGRGVVEAKPEFVRSLASAGVEIANHTYDHEWLTKLSDDEVRDDIEKAQRLITKITGHNNHWVRASGGAISADVLKAARKDGYYLVQWTIDSGDARGGADADETLNSVSNGAIILTHFGGDGTLDYLKRIVPALRERGFVLVTLSDLMKGMRIDQKLDVPPTMPVLRGLDLPPTGELAPLK